MSRCDGRFPFTAAVSTGVWEQSCRCAAAGEGLGGPRQTLVRSTPRNLLRGEGVGDGDVLGEDALHELLRMSVFAKRNTENDMKAG